MSKRFWFYNEWEINPRSEYTSMLDWFRGNFRGADEYGHHTVVIPLSKNRAMVWAYRAGYKRFRHCEDCVQARLDTFRFMQDAYYVQTYWNEPDLDTIYEWPDPDFKMKWDEALGVS